MNRKVVLMYSPHPAREAHRANLAAIEPGFNVTIARNEKHAIEETRDAEIILGHRYLRQSLPTAHRLKWVQSTAAGVDKLPLRELADRGIVLSRTSFASRSLARHAHTMAWALHRNLVASPAFQHDPLQLRWLPAPTRAIVFGMGAIGRELAVLLRRDGITVTGVKRRWDSESSELCDLLVDDASWQRALADADLCFCCLPYNRHTDMILNETVLEQLPNHAIFVNVGRAGTVDESALFNALSDGRLGGIGLDVALPDSPFRTAEADSGLNFILTPYIGAHYHEREDDLERFMESQMRNYVAGGEIQYRVDLERELE